MSWNVHAHAAPQSLFPAEIQDLEAAGADEEQLRVAKDAAQAIAESGAVGDGPFRVSLSGHGNPDRIPSGGSSVDVINVSVSQATIP